MRPTSACDILYRFAIASTAVIISGDTRNSIRSVNR